MPEMPDVVTSETIEVEWGNAIRDRTAQRYNDVTTRTSENGSPTEGDLAFMEDTGDLDIYYSGSWRHVGAPVGTVEMQAGATVPTGWLVCNGQAVSRTTYASLFTYLGGTGSPWGVGDGETTFNVPDLRGRVPRGVAASGTGNALGGTFGADTHTHTGPSHTHTGPSHTHSLSGTTLGPSGTNDVDEYDGGVIDTVSSSSHTHGVSGTAAASGTGNTGASGTGNTGSGSTIQAGAALHFRIKT